LLAYLLNGRELGTGGSMVSASYIVTGKEELSRCDEGA